MALGDPVRLKNPAQNLQPYYKITRGLLSLTRYSLAQLESHLLSDTICIYELTKHRSHTSATYNQLPDVDDHLRNPGEWPRVKSSSKNNLCMILHEVCHPSCCSKHMPILKGRMPNSACFHKISSDDSRLLEISISMSSWVGSKHIWINPTEQTKFQLQCMTLSSNNITDALSKGDMGNMNALSSTASTTIRHKWKQFQSWLIVCLHRAGHQTGTKSKKLMLSMSILRQWRGQFFCGHLLLTVDRPTTGNVILSTSIHVRHWPFGQPQVYHLSTVDRPSAPAGS